MATVKTVKKQCVGKCRNKKALNNFYNSSSPAFPDGKVNICKACIIDMIDINNVQTVYDVLQLLDVPFLEKYWNKALETENPWGYYIRMCNSGLNEFKGLRFKDSVRGDESNPIRKDGEDQPIKRDSSLDWDGNYLVEKWGYGYTNEELNAFEKKYILLKDNYPQHTAMHTEALLIYIRYRVKEEFATASGNVGEADKWGKLADKASERAKINPSQLTKSDLSGGLNSFGEVARAVEKAKDIIPILPKFMEKPQDKVDFTLLCYINYIRRMKNLPDATFKEVWEFYEERKKEYQKQDDKAFEIGGEENV